MAGPLEVFRMRAFVLNGWLTTIAMKLLHISHDVAYGVVGHGGDGGGVECHDCVVFIVDRLVVSRW